MKNHNRQMNTWFITLEQVAGIYLCSGLFNQGDVDIETI